MKRRLATILVADVVGYSSLMEADEEGTVARLGRCRAITDSEIATSQGRLFKAMGDAVLAEFDSPINAVRCAVGIRDALALTEEPQNVPLQMRFGLHLADVLVEGDDLLGDGVNLAARIQQAAKPGAIDLSSALFEQIRRTSPYAFDDLGNQTFKNLSTPVRVFRLRGEIGRHRYQVSPAQEASSRDRRPNSLAVIPVEAHAGNDDYRYLAEGITEELIIELSRFRRLFVTSRSASETILTSRPDPISVGERLGVRYVLNGSIRPLGQRVRLSLSLSETETGGVVWSDRLNFAFDDLTEQLDEIVSKIAATVLGRIEQTDIAAARRLRPESMSAYEYHLRGLEYHRLGGITDENLENALGWFERAIDADPNFSRPQVMWVCARSGLPGFDWDDGEKRTQRALELDPNDPEANRVMGSILMHRGAFDAARQYHEKAMALSPADAYIRARSAAFYNFSGEPERALQLLDEAEALDPFLPVWCVEERLAALYQLGRYAEAIEAARKLSFQTRRSRLYRAACRVALGNLDRARQIVAEACAANPNLTTEFLVSGELYRDRAFLDQLIDHLIEAGLPEAAPVPTKSDSTVKANESGAAHDQDETKPK